MYHGIFDTHAHYDDERYDDNRDAVLNRQAANGVTGIINAGSDLASSARALEIAARFPFVYAACGVHPHCAADVPANYLDQLSALLAHPKAIALGEIGLDYYYPEPARDVQRAVFSDQLDLANQLGKPVQIHDRDAHGDIFALVKAKKPAGCLHRYSGSVEMAREYVKLGLYLGIGGALTFKNAKREREVVREIPLEFLILETDCPYLAPEPFRGKTATSDMLWAVADAIAELRGIPPQHVVDATRENALRAFSITIG